MNAGVEGGRGNCEETKRRTLLYGPSKPGRMWLDRRALAAINYPGIPLLMHAYLARTKNQSFIPEVLSLFCSLSSFLFPLPSSTHSPVFTISLGWREHLTSYFTLLLHRLDRRSSAQGLFYEFTTSHEVNIKYQLSNKEIHQPSFAKNFT